ncbi:MAG: tol-pal system protein YbgF [Pseudomonadota bacterium]
MNQNHVIPFLLLGLVACGTPKRVQTSVEALERDNVALRSRQAELQRKIEDLSNSLMVLQDRLETLKVAAERQPVYSGSGRGKRGKLRPPPPPVEGEESDETAFGFGIAGNPRLPSIQLTNRDLERMAPVEKTPPKSMAKEAAPAPVKEDDKSSIDNPEVTREYNEAFQKFEDASYPEAIRMLGEFAGRHPAHVYADNAAFWIGESYFRTRDFVKAAESFERVATEFPSGNKVPDALLRAASCYLRLSKPKEAQRTFDRIIATYPQSVAAQKARASLAEMSEAGTGQRRM